MSASTECFQLEKDTQLQDQTLRGEKTMKLILKVSLLTILLNYLWELEVYLPTRYLYKPFPQQPTYFKNIPFHSMESKYSHICFTN